LGSRGLKVVIDRGSFCGIYVQGTVDLLEGEKVLDLRFYAAETPLGETLRCLGVKEGLADGDFLMEGSLKARGVRDPLKEGSRGSLYLYSGEGRIYRLTVLSRLFSVVNLTEVFRGKLPDFTGRGFPYDRLEVWGDIRDGVLWIREGIIEGPSMKIFAEGKVELYSGRLDLKVLVAPFRTVDALLSRVPLLGYILTGKSKTFLSLPFHIKGDYRKPEVTPLPPSAVGRGLLGIVERTLKMPFKVIEPVLP